MPLEEITGTRDLTFSTWHRTLPPDCTWIDIDCCHYCRYCSSLLALFELVRSPDAESLAEACLRKPAAITERLAIRLAIPAYKVAYTGTPLAAAAVMRLGETTVQVLTAHQLAQFIDEIHNCAFCRSHRNGRFAIRGADCKGVAS